MSSKQKEFSSLLELMRALPDEQTAIDHFTAIRWRDGEFCPYCGSTSLYHFSDKRTHKCADCRQRFSIKVGTIFEDSKLSLRTWMLAVWYVTQHKKIISSVQLAKDLDITQKSAWFVMHRLRHAARTRSFNKPMGGEVEIDETFVGGKARNKRYSQRGKSGVTGGTGKAIVVGALQRKGRVVARVVENVRAETLERFVDETVSPSVELVATDKWVGYKHLGKKYPHVAVDHADGEYVRGRAHTNGVESFWAQLKRQIYGTHHWVSRKHLERYVDESTWRHNRRDLPEAPRFDSLLEMSDGRRLRYAELIA
ncbi:MAG TPA: IS1595 family transposase [Rhizomicrobium sp.]|jgi:transposase-like protein